jgi:signal peptidase I
MNSSFIDAIKNFVTDSTSNPYGLLLSILIFIFMLSLFFAIFSKKIRHNLIKWKILEKEESPGKLLLLIISILVIVKLIQAFVVQPFLVDGGSMLPNLKSGELLLIDKLNFDVNNLERGDVIVFRHVKSDQYNGKFFIKRLIGLPGDTVVVRDGFTTIYNKANPNGFILNENFVTYRDTVKNINISLGENEYLAFGDNRRESYDSRSWGVIYKKNISGKAVFRLFPFNKIGSDPGKVEINFIKL